MNLSDHQTTKLLNRAADGSKSAVRQLLVSHGPRLRRLVAIRLDRRLRSRLDPSDVVQDVITNAYVRLPAYLEHRDLPFYAWLRQLAWDHLVRLHDQHVKVQKRSVTREVHGTLDVDEESMLQLATRLSPSTPSQQSIRNEVTRRVHQALASLSAEDRELLVMKHLEGLTLAELAATLDLTMSAVKGRHLRALKRLGDRIKEMGDLP